MRSSQPTTSLAALLAAALLAGAGAPAFAQGSPSADQIIQSLRPGGSMSGGTRGIRPVGPSSEPPAAGGGYAAPAQTPAAPRVASPGHVAPAAPGVVARTASTPSVNLTVQFATNSAELTPAAMRTLDELGRALSSQSLSGYRFRIEGHTDATGNPEHNKALSEQRAAKVVDYLTSKFGVDRAKVEAIGMGQEQPLAPAAANRPEPRNRRVTVVNLGA